PAPPAVSLHTVRGRRGMAVRRQRLPSAPRGCTCATSFALATSCTLARVCTRPQRLHQSLTRVSSLSPSSPAAGGEEPLRGTSQGDTGARREMRAGARVKCGFIFPILKLGQVATVRG